MQIDLAGRTALVTGSTQGIGLAIATGLAHPVTAAVIPGASRPSRIAEDLGALRAEIPAAFWHDLRETGLLDPAAPLPAGA